MYWLWSCSYETKLFLGFKWNGISRLAVTWVECGMDDRERTKVRIEILVLYRYIKYYNNVLSHSNFLQYPYIFISLKIYFSPDYFLTQSKIFKN